MCEERYMHQSLLFTVITGCVPFVRPAYIIFTHYSTASLICSFFIIKALFHLSIAIWFCYVALNDRWSALSHSYHVQRRERSGCETLSSVSVRISNRTWQPLHTATSVWLYRTKDVTHWHEIDDDDDHHHHHRHHRNIHNNTEVLALLHSYPF
jgi:hypothetical protein